MPETTNGGEKAGRSGRAAKNGKRNGHILHRPARKPGSQILLHRFTPILGKRRARESLEVLADAHTAYTSLKRSVSAIRGRGANIFTQWVGDPDALGSAVLLRAILLELGAKEVRILTGSLAHPQNRNLVAKCGIVLQHPNEARLPRGLQCMVDTSPPLGWASTTGVDPVKEFFFVADHHADFADVEQACRAAGVKRVKLSYVGLNVGSTSAFMAVLAAAFGLIEHLKPAIRAAAALGIFTDTSSLLHGATPLDFRMFEILTRDEETQDLLDELRDYRVPPEWYAYRAAAYRNLETTGAVRIAPIGYVSEEHRDVIAEIASELLRVEGTVIGVTVAVTERGSEISIRGDSRLLGGDPSRIVRVVDRLLETEFPGVSGYKYQRRPPHRVEGGACRPLTEKEERTLRLGSGVSAEGPDAALEHCRDVAERLIDSLRVIHDAAPEETAGILA